MNPTRTVVTLGLGQIAGWGSTFYLPAILAPAMAADLGVSRPVVFAAFSSALIVAALIGPMAGRVLDRHGGKPVLALTNVVFALGLLLLATVRSAPGLFAAWAVLGLGMGSGLYEAAFATVVRIYGQAARNAITGITLIAGFASTVAWPLSQWLLSTWGWRETCVAWALVQLLVALPLHLSLPRMPAFSDAATAQRGSSAPAAGDAAPATHALRNTFLLAYAFAAVWFIASAMAAHLPILLSAAGASTALAVTAAALVGPAQVAARLLEFALQQRVSPLRSARLAALTHPIGVVLLILLGPAGCIPFVLLHGAGNGVLTIAKGTLPLVFFGPHGYGARQGWLMMPARVALAVSPFLFGLVIERLGLAAMWLSAALGATVFGALLALRRS